MWICLFFLSLFSSAADDCAMGSYAVIGNALKKCEAGIMGGTSYGDPNNAEVLQFLKSEKSSALEPGFQKLFNLNRDGLKKYLEEGIQTKNYQTEMTANDPASIGDLKALADGVNTELGMDPYIESFKRDKQMAADQKNRADGLSLDDMIKIQLGQRNASNLGQLQKDCRSNPSTKGKLEPVRVNFADGDKQITLITGLEKTSEGYQMEFVDENRDNPVQKRTIKKDASGAYVYYGKDGVAYPLKKGKEFEAVSSQLIGTMQGMGGNMSNACVFASNSATTGYGQVGQAAGGSKINH